MVFVRILITISNIYNSHNNIKFTKEKKKKRWKKKIYPVLDFLKVKYHTNKKRKEKKVKINHYTVHTLNTNYYLKYL